MPAGTTDERRRSFDQMAELYARARGAPRLRGADLPRDARLRPPALPGYACDVLGSRDAACGAARAAVRSDRRDHRRPVRRTRGAPFYGAAAARAAALENTSSVETIREAGSRRGFRLRRRGRCVAPTAPGAPREGRSRGSRVRGFLPERDRRANGRAPRFTVSGQDVRDVPGHACGAITSRARSRACCNTATRPRASRSG
jgi:hypothetical protein